MASKHLGIKIRAVGGAGYKVHIGKSNAFAGEIRQVPYFGNKFHSLSPSLRVLGTHSSVRAAAEHVAKHYHPGTFDGPTGARLVPKGTRIGMGGLARPMVPHNKRLIYKIPKGMIPRRAKKVKII